MLKTSIIYIIVTGVFSWFEKIRRCYRGIGVSHFASKNSAFTSSIKKDLVLIRLSLILRAKNILKMFSTINKNRIKALIAFWLCLYTWSAFHVETISLKHLFSICHLAWHIDTTFFKLTIEGRLVTQIQSAFSWLISHFPNSAA